MSEEEAQEIINCLDNLIILQNVVYGINTARYEEILCDYHYGAGNDSGIWRMMVEEMQFLSKENREKLFEVYRAFYEEVNRLKMMNFTNNLDSLKSLVEEQST